MNPLVESCKAISKAGYSGETDIEQAYLNPRLLRLGTFLLNNSKLSSTFRLKEQRRGSSVCICMGGGIDSYIAIHEAFTQSYEKVVLLHVDYSQPYNTLESQVFNLISRAAQLSDSAPRKWFDSDFDRMRSKFGKLNVSIKQVVFPLIDKETKLDFSWENYIVPARNLLLAALASEHADDIWIVANKRADETVGTPDKTSRFYMEASETFSEFYGRQVRVFSPFFKVSKLQAVTDWISQGGDPRILKITHSCYADPATLTWDILGARFEQYTPESLEVSSEKNPATHCGECYACYKRYKLFQSLNIVHFFRTHPQDGKNWHQYARAEQNKGR